MVLIIHGNMKHKQRYLRGIKGRSFSFFLLVDHPKNSMCLEFRIEIIAPFRLKISTILILDEKLSCIFWGFRLKDGCRLTRIMW